MSTYSSITNINDYEEIQKHGPSKGRPKNKFTREEDEKLIEAYKKYGPFDWDRIAEELVGRTSRQCRDRWNYYLNPKVTNQPWSEYEEQLLLEKYKRHGPKWALISHFFNSRTDINVKNHFYVLQRRFMKNNTQTKISPKKAHDIEEYSIFPGVSLIFQRKTI